MSFNITFKVGKNEKTATFIGAVHKGGAPLKVARDSALALSVARAENCKFFDMSLLRHSPTPRRGKTPNAWPILLCG